MRAATENLLVHLRDTIAEQHGVPVRLQLKTWVAKHTYYLHRDDTSDYEISPVKPSMPGSLHSATTYKSLHYILAWLMKQFLEEQ